MERFLYALLRRPVRFVFESLVHEGRDVRGIAKLPDGGSWRDTKSCWRNARWSALNGKLVQCGICAACMLRRMSVHAAGLVEDLGTYICADLSAPSLREAVHRDFRRMGPAFRELHAIAGTLHLVDIADMARMDSRGAVRLGSPALTSAALGISALETETRLVAMLETHDLRNGIVS